MIIDPIVKEAKGYQMNENSNANNERKISVNVHVIHVHFVKNLFGKFEVTIQLVYAF